MLLTRFLRESRVKVKISDYPNRLTCRIFMRYMENKYGADWPEEINYNRTERLLDRVEDVVQKLYSPVNYFLDKREQKISVKIDRWDTWSMDHTLAHIVLPMLVQLKRTKHGAPVVDNDDVPEELRMSDKWYEEKYSVNGETDENFFKRWDYVLDEMIWAFNEKCRDDWRGDYYYNKWDMDGYNAHQERISNGFRLFGKYYESLWD